MINKLYYLLLSIFIAAFVASSAQATIIYNADNEGFTLGSTPPTTGPLDAPTSIDSNLGLTVENGSTVVGPSLGPDQFLRLTESAGEAPDFRYDGGTSYTSGLWLVSMDLLFENLENYHVYFRESGSSAQSVANIRFNSSGGISIQSTGGTSSASYLAGTSYELLAYLDLDADLMDVFLNGVQIVSDQAILDVFGAAIIGFEFTSFDAGPGFDGAMQVDNFRIASVDVPEPASLLLVGLGLAGFRLSRRSN